ncbi:hypothetical protein [Flavobacterium tructae]|uniref:hypothetical protein n=1 Tax=Flavobacterium tructae TaxID=1114873 RepID=UPI0035A84AF9
MYRSYGTLQNENPFFNGLKSVATKYFIPSGIKIMQKDRPKTPAYKGIKNTPN